MARAFVITVVGTFSGRRDEAPLRPIAIDRDDFDAVFRALAPRVEPGLPSCPEATLSSWEDFRPEGLVEKIPELRDLMAARAAADDPERWAERLRTAGIAADETPPAPPPSRAPAPAPDGASLLEAMLDAKRPASDPVEQRIREIVAASADHTDYAAQDRRRALVDEALGGRLRALLGHPAFRRMESRWTALRRLVRAVETSEELRIRVLDVPPDDAAIERAADLLAAETDERTNVVVSDRILDASDAGFATLSALAALAEGLDVPVLAAWNAAASPPESLAGEPRWTALRAAAGARRLGLCAPRILTRLPFGRDTDPVESFAFEEEADVEHPGTYSWGSAAFALAAAAAAAWSADGTLARLDRFLEIESLPQHASRTAGAAATCGPVEMEMTETRIETWKAAGLIPVTGIRGRDVARILSLRSLSSEPLFR